MSANLNEIDGRVSMAAWGRIPVWHGTGQRSDELMTVEEAHILAGTDYRVVTVPNWYRDENGEFKPGKGVQIMREDTDAILGTASDDYKVIQNREVFEMFAPLIDAGDLGGVMTAGVLGDGERAWMQCVLGSIALDDRDVAVNTLLATTDHAARGCAKIGFQSVWVVCGNTEAAAQHEWNRSGNYMSVRHNGNVKGALADIRKLLDIAGQGFLTWRDVAYDLSRVPVYADGDIYRLAIETNPMPDKTLAKIIAGNHGRAGHWMRQYQAVLDEWNGGPGMDAVSRRNTAWGAYNAITGFVDYTRTNRDLSKPSNRTAAIRSQWFGTGAEIKNRALTATRKHLVDREPWSEKTEDTVNALSKVVLASN